MLHSPALEITWAQVAAMCCGAARGMLHLHAHSILHRDLKSGESPVSDFIYNVQGGLCICQPPHTPPSPCSWSVLHACQSRPKPGCVA